MARRKKDIWGKEEEGMVNPVTQVRENKGEKDECENRKG